MVEEVAQSLGPANDSPLLPASIINGTSRTSTVFCLFDLVHPEHALREPAESGRGMTEEDALAGAAGRDRRDVRAWMPEAL